MAVTRIADVIVPDVFDPYTTERSTELAKLYTGGIIANDAMFDKLAQTGGKLINMPFWNDLTGTDEVLSDTTGLTPTGITASQDVAVLFMRGKSWGANDLAKSLSGDDPMRQIGDLVADFWARRMQTLLLNLVTGVFADNTANDSADMTLDISHATDGASATAANKISASAVIDAAGTMGDAASSLTAMIMHSVVYQNLQKQNLITYTPVSTQSAQIPTYLGHRVMVDDSIPRTVSGSGYKYPVYIFGDGAVAMGNGNAPYPSETGRDKALGEDYLYSRRHFILHPRGIAFQSSSVAGSSPTNAEVALAANWNRVWNRKHVRIARLIVNG
jgi:hypothetical protein